MQWIRLIILKKQLKEKNTAKIRKRELNSFFPDKMIPNNNKNFYETEKYKY